MTSPILSYLILCIHKLLHSQITIGQNKGKFHEKKWQKFGCTTQYASSSYMNTFNTLVTTPCNKRKTMNYLNKIVPPEINPPPENTSCLEKSFNILPNTVKSLKNVLRFNLHAKFTSLNMYKNFFISSI